MGSCEEKTGFADVIAKCKVYKSIVLLQNVKWQLYNTWEKQYS